MGLPPFRGAACVLPRTPACLTPRTYHHLYAPRCLARTHTMHAAPALPAIHTATCHLAPRGFEHRPRLPPYLPAPALQIHFHATPACRLPLPLGAMVQDIALCSLPLPCRTAAPCHHPCMPLHAHFLTLLYARAGTASQLQLLQPFCHLCLSSSLHTTWPYHTAHTINTAPRYAATAPFRTCLPFTHMTHCHTSPSLLPPVHSLAHLSFCIPHYCHHTIPHASFCLPAFIPLLYTLPPLHFAFHHLQMHACTRTRCLRTHWAAFDLHGTLLHDSIRCDCRFVEQVPLLEH